MQFSNSAYLLIGGNEGERLNYLQEAIKKLNEQAGTVTRRSAIYQTAPWGNTEQPDFLNQALELRTSPSPETLMTQILLIEQEMGRRRFEKNGPRIIDIDILLYNAQVLNSALLTVPHKELQHRRFALQPLADIAGEKVHPVLNRTIRELLATCDDPLAVTVYSG